MATFIPVHSLTEFLAEKRINLGSDQLVVALTNTAHTATWDELADLTQVSYTNLSSRNITTSSSSQTSGTYKLVLADLTLTATGSVGPFRYIYIYDDTATNDDLIGYFDYGSSISLNNGDTFLIDFSAANGVLQITIA
jgi:hypothetical protein